MQMCPPGYHYIAISTYMISLCITSTPTVLLYFCLYCISTEHSINRCYVMYLYSGKVDPDCLGGLN